VTIREFHTSEENGCYHAYTIDFIVLLSAVLKKKTTRPRHFRQQP